MENMPDKKILTFDCYGTLIDWETGILNHISPALSGCDLNDDEILKLFAQSEYKIQSDNPQLKYQEVLQKVIKKIGDDLSIAISDREVADFGLSVRNWAAFPDTIAALQKLSAHFKLIIVSNIDNDSIAATKNQLNIDFYRTYTAQDIGAYKPDLKVFNYVFNQLAKEGYHKDEVLHVAESLYHDHVPAKKMGFDSVWINRRFGKSSNGATPKVEKQWEPEYQFKDLASFAEWALTTGK